METITITATEFKAKCLQLLDQVAREEKRLIVTKRGQPVAEVIPPLTERDPLLAGKWLGQAESVGDIVNYSPWLEALREDEQSRQVGHGSPAAR